jgi:predicted TIM-barrel fold metal-dependent hydrolase
MKTHRIDTHTHIFPPDITNNRDRYLGADLWFRRLYQKTRHRLASGDDLIQSMDKSGLDASVTFGFAWRDAGLCRDHNDYVLDVAASSKGRIIPFCVTPPTDIDFSVQELERCHALGAVGVGELFPQGQGWNLSDSTAVQLFVDIAKDLNMVLLVHTSELLGHNYAGKDSTTTAPAIWKLVEATEGTMPIILAHWGIGMAIHELMPEINARTQNVFYDSSASHLLYNSSIYEVMAKLAPGRTLFGSDYPLISQATAIRHATDSNLQADELSSLFGGAASKIVTQSME